MKKLILTLLFGISMTWGYASARIIIVPVEYSTIQEGIDASSDGDTVLVKPGIYYENINFNGHNIVVASFFLTDGNPEYIDQTVIDGDLAGSVVTFEGGENSSTVIKGFSIVHGRAPNGGGVYCIDLADPAICRNKIFNNSAYYTSGDTDNGGGIYCYNSTPTITDNIIMNNSACDGGGIYCDEASPTIEFNVISDNTAAP